MFFPSNYPLFHVVLSTPASVTIIRIRLVSYYQAFLCCNCGLDNNEQMPLVECLTSSISIFSPQSRGYYGYFYSRGAVSAPWLLPPARFIFFRPRAYLIWCGNIYAWTASFVWLPSFVYTSLPLSLQLHGCYRAMHTTLSSFAVNPGISVSTVMRSACQSEGRLPCHDVIISSRQRVNCCVLASITSSSS